MYNKTVMDHFRNPRNVGTIEDADGVGEEWIELMAARAAVLAVDEARGLGRPGTPEHGRDCKHDAREAGEASRHLADRRFKYYR